MKTNVFVLFCCVIACSQAAERRDDNYIYKDNFEKTNHTFQTSIVKIRTNLYNSTSFTEDSASEKPLEANKLETPTVSNVPELPLQDYELEIPLLDKAQATPIKKMLDGNKEIPSLEKTPEMPLLNKATEKPIKKMLDANKVAKSLLNEKDISPDGHYHYAYETSNGIAAAEHGASGIAVEGINTYFAPDGTEIKVSYFADDHGYHPVGDHIPKTPDYIIRGLEWIKNHPFQEVDRKSGETKQANIEAKLHRYTKPTYMPKIELLPENYRSKIKIKTTTTTKAPATTTTTAATTTTADATTAADAIIAANTNTVADIIIAADTTLAANTITTAGTTNNE